LKSQLRSSLTSLLYDLSQEYMDLCLIRHGQSLANAAGKLTDIHWVLERFSY